LGAVLTEAGKSLHVEATFETVPGVLFDALAIPGGKDAVRAREAGAGGRVRQGAIPARQADLGAGRGRRSARERRRASRVAFCRAGPGLLVERHATAKDVLPRFVKAVARRRHHELKVDPPAV
jgi:catalase